MYKYVVCIYCFNNFLTADVYFQTYARDASLSFH